MLKCSYETNQKTNLNTHMKRHIKAPTHPCTYCVKKFSIRSDRDKHEYTLMNIKLFQCTICSAKFKQKNGLINHKKVHEEPMEICQKCDQVFSSKSKFEEERRDWRWCEQQQGGEKPYHWHPCKNQAH